MSFRSWLRTMLRRSSPAKPCNNRFPLLVVIEGPHDIESSSVSAESCLSIIPRFRT